MAKSETLSEKITKVKMIGGLAKVVVCLPTSARP
jgi:hypothetical protein